MPKFGKIKSMYPNPHEHWWLSGGVSPSDRVGVWAGKGAASYAASLVASNNPTAPAMYEDGTTPGWDTGVGWIAASGAGYDLVGDFSSSYTDNYTFIVKYSGAAVDIVTWIGASNTVIIHSAANDGGAYKFAAQDNEGAYHYDGAAKGSGVASITGILYDESNVTIQAYLDGAAVIDPFLTSVSLFPYFSILPSNGIKNVSSVAYYGVALTQAQIAAIGAAMP